MLLLESWKICLEKLGTIKTYWNAANASLTHAFCSSLLTGDLFAKTSCLQWLLEISSYPFFQSFTNPKISTFVKQDSNHRSNPEIHLLSQLELPVKETMWCVTHCRAIAGSIRSCSTAATVRIHLYSRSRTSLELEPCHFSSDCSRCLPLQVQGKIFGS